MLDDACKKARMDLDAIVCDNIPQMDQQSLYKSRMLMDRLNDITPITPWGLFQVGLPDGRDYCFPYLTG